MPIKKEIIEYYREVDFSIWEKSVNICFDKLKKLKTDKAKTPWALKMYANYLQLIEIFCINVWIITYFLESWVFGIQEKEAINNLSQKRKTYATILREALEDYLKDYDLLNAYKHGFRTKGRGGSNLSIKKEVGNTKPITIGSYNTTIIYLSKREKTIYECRLAFNWERVSQKYFFLLNMLENTQKVLLADNGKIKLDTLYPLDNKEFNKYYGAFRVNIPIAN